MKARLASLAIATIALTSCGTAADASPPAKDAKTGAKVIIHKDVDRKPLKQTKMKVSKEYLEKIKTRKTVKKVDKHAEIKAVLKKQREYVPPAPVETVVAPPAPVAPIVEPPAPVIEPPAPVEEILPPVVAQPEQIETAIETIPVTPEVVKPVPVQTPTPEPIPVPKEAPVIPTPSNWAADLLISRGLTPPADIRMTDVGNCGGPGGGCAMVGAGVMWISPTAHPHIVFHEYAHAVLGIRDECAAEEFAWSITGDRNVASYLHCL